MTKMFIVIFFFFGILLSVVYPNMTSKNTSFGTTWLAISI